MIKKHQAHQQSHHQLHHSVYAYFLNPIFDSHELEGTGGIIVEIFILLYVFCGFGVICDKYLIPAIERIKEKYNMSERLAGATILALGSSISDIASNLNAILMNKHEEFEMGLAGIIGGNLFMLTVGMAIGSFLVNKKGEYKINYTAVVRDIMITIMILIILFFFLNSKEIDLLKVIKFNEKLEFLFSWRMGVIYGLLIPYVGFRVSIQS